MTNTREKTSASMPRTLLLVAALGLTGACAPTSDEARDDDALGAPEQASKPFATLAQVEPARPLDRADCDEIYSIRAADPNDKNAPFSVPAGS